MKAYAIEYTAFYDNGHTVTTYRLYSSRKKAEEQMRLHRASGRYQYTDHEMGVDHFSCAIEDARFATREIVVKEIL